MATFLDVTRPQRPAKFASSTRLVYRVVFESGQMVTLPELAEQLKIPYAALANAVHKKFATVGKHGEDFLKVLQQTRADEKRKADKRGRLKCPTCHGLGEVTGIAPVTANETA